MQSNRIAFDTDAARAYFEEKGCRFEVGRSNRIVNSIVRGLIFPHLQGTLVGEIDGAGYSPSSSLSVDDKNKADYLVNVHVFCDPNTVRYYEVPEGYKEVEKAKGYMNNVDVCTRAFRNTKTNRIVIATEELGNVNERKAFAALMPVLFDYAVPFSAYSKDEQEVLFALDLNKSLEILSEAFDKLAKNFDFQSAYRRKMLDSFINGINTRVIKNSQEKYARVNRDIENTYRSLARLERELEVAKSALATAKSYLFNSDELIEFCDSCKAITSVDTNAQRFFEDALIFEIQGVFEYFEPECAKRVINNSGSYIYRGLNDKEKAELKKLMNAVFVDETIKMKTMSHIAMTADGPTSIAGRFDNDDYEDRYEEENAMKNPHMFHYNCFGDNRRLICDAMSSGDIVGALEQVIAAAFSINFLDYTVVDTFAHELVKNDEIKCYLLPDGREVNWGEALAYLDSK